MSKKRTLDSFFKPLSQHNIAPSLVTGPASSSTISTKKQRVNVSFDHPADRSHELPSTHPTYPFPIPLLPASVLSALGPPSSAQTELAASKDNGKNTEPSPDPSSSALTNSNATCPASIGHPINDQPYLDLVYYEPFLPRSAANALFSFLRTSLPFYRVRYRIQRGGIDTQINTPRYTTVFGVDESSRFDALSGLVTERESGRPVAKDRYGCRPRPMPDCLDRLRVAVERETGERFNFCLVNYYASGEDSISYHSDDERFLGKDPAIASLSLGARRDFCMKRKPQPKGTVEGEDGKSGKAEKPLKLALGSGDMVLMRGTTQANWLHSVPKRKGGESGRGRINITFRGAMVRGGTENYYQYNVGDGPVYRWDEAKGEMRVWEPAKEDP
ncbi:Alpha-ketoglutarate-dependent dioxygenase alkB-like protein 3 [Lasiodiplodia hormozganensis]|uniref:Alpha-ketoglutarate-dependent dioxygenase alkB-like protein 3 n=1 Tax=Lasiodiplodia hormozganensis TaxID=869390 RepID=A0AA39Z2W2_9PEZI|nr:Alpha-ketoglutarate-dependent dioxygenase alkB-like protein 3 [Lasiodiplodia hormozganensis]